MILEQIYSAIVGDASVMAIMGTRLFPMRLEQSTQLPAAVYEVITGDPVSSLDGDSNLDLLRVQITSWATTYTEAKDLSEAIRNALDLDASIKFTTASIDDDQDENTKNYSVVMQFSVWSA